MAPKKIVSKKKEDVIEIPPMTSLPDGPKTFFIGGWSAFSNFATGLSGISELVAAKTEAEEATKQPTSILIINPIPSKESGEQIAKVTHLLVLSGVLPAHVEKGKMDVAARRGGVGKIEDAAGGGAGGADDAAAEGGDANQDEANNSSATKKVARRAVLKVEGPIVAGNIVLEGMPPPVDVKPIAPEVAAPPKAAEKGKKKTEEEKLKEIEAQKIKEALALQLALAEEERLSKFAIPHRWPKISISNVIFQGKITVKRCHVTFHNCHFTPSLLGGETNLLEVHQYCETNLKSCSFSQPTKAAIYAFPLSLVTATGCVFSGIEQPTDDAGVEKLSYGAPEDLPRKVKEAEERAPRSIGVYSDGSMINLSSCHFEYLATGCLVRGKYVVSKSRNVSDDAPPVPTEASGSAPPRPTPTSVICKSTFQNLFTTGIHTVSASLLSLKRNVITLCGYYGVNVEKSSPEVLFNQIDAKFVIGKGSTPFLHSNKLTTALEDKNGSVPVFMEPKY